jgi:hypothetical protein
MRHWRPPPTIPPDLLDRYGEPEHVFGPNMRFRVASFLLGGLLLLLGLAFSLFGVAARAAQGFRGSEGVLLLLGAGLMAVGAAAVLIPRSVPLNWVFVCPAGLVRIRGADWDAVGWADVSRFEDASFSVGAVTSRQCRIITAAGAEWGFQADWVAEYGRLVAVLRRKVEERPTPLDPGSRPAPSQ